MEQPMFIIEFKRDCAVQAPGLRKPTTCLGCGFANNGVYKKTYDKTPQKKNNKPSLLGTSLPLQHQGLPPNLPSQATPSEKQMMRTR